ncbi:hypothetical protein Vadar_034637 [Vaccinium darrowii]|uniref:Uncharacterized protein n=1 Tax=Vaccinium darrowii TaxID=229202 RepID=A0ACB7ZIG5_9ERIC|nr:hypothetical protein Vadar_034637 [Vaccinium darrowii]
MAQRLIDKDRRLKVPIPPQFCAPIGEHAAKMASKIGYEVWTNVIDLGVRRWKVVDDIVKAPILQRLTVVARSTYVWFHKLQSYHYLKYQIWQDKFDLQGDPMDVDKAQSLVNTNNRASEKHLKLRCGSKSFSVRVATADEMEKIEVEHNSQEGAVPMTQEDLSIKVFKKRSGYVKGLGMRPSSSVRTYVNSYEYVTNLEKDHVEKIEASNTTIVELVEAKEQANATIADLVEAKEQQGRTLASVLEFLKQQGYTGVS